MGVRAEDFESAEEGLKTIVKTVEILGRERLLLLLIMKQLQNA